MADWSTISALATGGGTLVLALATFASVRSSNRTARIAEQSLLIGVRPLLMPSRLEDPPFRVFWSDEHLATLRGGIACVDVVDGQMYLAFSLRNAANGIAVLQAWSIITDYSPSDPPSDLDAMRRQGRDLYIPAGDVGFSGGGGVAQILTDVRCTPAACCDGKRRPSSISSQRPRGRAAGDQSVLVGLFGALGVGSWRGAPLERGSRRPASTGLNREVSEDPSTDPRRWFTLAIVITSIVHRGARQLGSQRLAIPDHPCGVPRRCRACSLVVSGHAVVRDAAHHRRPSGRPRRPRRMFTIGALALRYGLVARGTVVVGAEPRPRRGPHRGDRRVVDAPGDARHPLDHVRGRERATAFAAWGAPPVRAAFGPVVGGFLTTNYSWRWAFGVNVIVAPFAIVGALTFMRKGTRADHRVRIDVPGAVMVAAGLFLLVFALSEGGTYGWLDPIKDFRLAGSVVWPSSLGLSMIPFVVVAAVVMLGAFTAYERWKERRGDDPLFEFGQLRHKGFRYGLLTSLAVSMGQLGMLFVVPVFLQDGERLSAETSGFWMIPVGLFILAGAQLGRPFTRRIGVTRVVQLGLASEAAGLLILAPSIAEAHVH